MPTRLTAIVNTSTKHTDDVGTNECVGIHEPKKGRSEKRGQYTSGRNLGSGDERFTVARSADVGLRLRQESIGSRAWGIHQRKKTPEFPLIPFWSLLCFPVFFLFIFKIPIFATLSNILP